MNRHRFSDVKKDRKTQQNTAENRMIAVSLKIMKFSSRTTPVQAIFLFTRRPITDIIFRRVVKNRSLPETAV